MKKIAGVDVGTTLVKFCWQGDDGLRTLMSTSTYPIADIIKCLRQDSITHLHIVGIGRPPLEISEFKWKRAGGDPFVSEVILQAKGAKQLLAEQGKSINQFLLVSIGTGISYTFVDGEAIKSFPIGNAMGGGFLRAIGMSKGIHDIDNVFDPSTFDACASRGSSLDILVRELIPGTSETLMGEFVVSHFGHVDANSKKDDWCATAVGCVAALIARDILLMNMISGFTVPEHVVFIGSVPQWILSVVTPLHKYGTMLGKKSLYPSRGDFALAIGAWLEGNTAT